MIETLKQLTKNISNEPDAYQFVRIYLDALGIEDREPIYDELAKDDQRFKNIFVLRMVIPTSDFNESGRINLGSKDINREVLKNNYHGILYIKEGSGDPQDPIVDEYYIATSSFSSRNAIAYIPQGKNTNTRIQKLSQEGIYFYGVLEIRTEKYQEYEPVLRQVKLGKREKEAIVNTKFFEGL